MYSRIQSNQQQPQNFSLPAILRLVRATNLLIVALTQAIVGVVVRPAGTDWLPQLLKPSLWMLIAATVLVTAGGYIINDYYDIKIDIINKPSRVVIDRHLKRRIAIVLHLICTFLGIFLAFGLGTKMGLIVTGSAFVLWFYSNFLKRQPLWGNVAVAAMSALAVWLPAYYFQNRLLMIGLFAGYAFLVSLIREIVKDMEDMRGDARYGCRTLPIVWGIRRTKWLLVVLAVGFGLGLPIGAYKLPTLAMYYLLGLALPLVYFIRKLVAADKIRDYRYLSSFCKILMLLGVVTMLFV
ncbi:4-hydroxybenzoate polyprenyltransferase [Flexibacter flexilis DSM 6793]|uniref:4-hydroxybenzoate polyprenyltransferase n=1 Tax=Flexibacter flexilis DSM 6793 TaxID=927664 RepID=A0A1I1G960_9BACT|nr:geranylgeranylglycerol-phosphate geranylgeranyltransferase [Flexibacter flexilis]SFC07936.1 4-hydroxybenzoate polyprenyltransferase [Flexibacter flexilis DSM 6793]